MEMGQLLLSLLHAWGLDPDLDLLCETKLGLLRPLVPVSFGVLSKAGTEEEDFRNRCCKSPLEDLVSSIPHKARIYMEAQYDKLCGGLNF
ncbi:hypothetical protein GE061_010424 [Apolygus lucorum]|uniref:Uncharacterized protein n=1 Tax=Apolygus lucorum TaxID=248454 RepID=A0A8S9Y517_APOLU|nr:hypothetical protein GE061_010424 [Apolygus lucorum]